MAIANSYALTRAIQFTTEGTAGDLSPKHWIWERGAPPQMSKNISVCYFSSVPLLQEE